MQSFSCPIFLNIVVVIFIIIIIIVGFVRPDDLYVYSNPLLPMPLLEHSHISFAFVYHKRKSKKND
jgi:hypothetical protein